MDTTYPPAPALPRPAGGGVAARLRSLVLGRAQDPAWVRPAFLAVLVLTTVLYVWGLDRNGYANSYYSAAVLAATRSWKAFFFGALDAGSFITVDKPPAALWLMALSGRVFGFSTWSMLLPEALLGVASVALVADVVRRTAGVVAGLVAAVVMALTPVAVLMFRFNNPDALLTFLMVAAAWMLVRSLRTGRTRWLLLAAAAIGLAFLTKYMQAYVVLPALVLTYLLLGPRTWLRRIGELLAAAGVLVVSSGWWVAIVTLVPASQRPFIGGSTDNSVLNLIFGYDGFSRVFGAFGSFVGGAARGAGRAFAGGPGGPGGGGGGGGFGGQAGLLRLFNDQLAGEISWLLPLAAAALIAGLWLHRRSPRTDLARAGYVLWGGWLLTHAVVFSFAAGIFHPYYTVAMAPGVAGLVGAGAVDVWRLRNRSYVGAVVGAAGLVVTGWWGAQLLARTPSFLPGLGTAELVLAVAAAVVLLLPRQALAGVPRVAARAPAVALTVGLAAVLFGPAAYAIDTVSHADQGSIPSSGPQVSGGFGRPGGGGPPAGARFVPGDAQPGGFVRGGGFPGGNGFPAGGGATAQGGAPTFAGGGPGGDGGANSTLTAYLERNKGSATWLVAVASANQAAPIELATGQPVLAMGGFSGSDPAMTVGKLQALVRAGELRYVLVGGGGGGPDGGSQSVTSWVTQHGTLVSSSESGTSGLYDLSGAV
ncbi:MAG: glycosyltransferase family 39 protein [Chloroflexi bacterium]|nr:MAG: glycosyltransferase family 39 protein [Chloroflexota bacterium]